MQSAAASSPGIHEECLWPICRHAGLSSGPVYAVEQQRRQHAHQQRTTTQLTNSGANSYLFAAGQRPLAAVLMVISKVCLAGASVLPPAFPAPAPASALYRLSEQHSAVDGCISFPVAVLRDFSLAAAAAAARYCLLWLTPGCLWCLGSCIPRGPCA
jgi:hypothetical protein